jgi:ADP-ribose pyrophosphatase
MAKKPPKKSNRIKARVLSSRVVYRGPAFKVTADQVLEPSGVRTRRDIVHHSGSVVILAIEDGGSEPQVLLERQYRHAAQQMLWELPAGRIDGGEIGCELAAKRTAGGNRLHRVTLEVHSAVLCQSGFLAETMDVYSAHGLRRGKGSPRRTRSSGFEWCHFQGGRHGHEGRHSRRKTISGVLWLSQTRKG